MKFYQTYFESEDLMLTWICGTIVGDRLLAQIRNDHKCGESGNAQKELIDLRVCDFEDDFTMSSIIECVHLLTDKPKCVCALLLPENKAFHFAMARAFQIASVQKRRKIALCYSLEDAWLHLGVRTKIP